MQELQSDDYFIPAYHFKLPAQPETGQCEAQTEDFLKGIEGWSEHYPEDECVE